MKSTTAITEKLDTLALRGIVVTVSLTGTLQVRPGSLLSLDDREWFRIHTAAILTQLKVNATPKPTLTGNEAWNPGVAHQFLCDADALVERLGINGHHPAVKDAAAMVTSAFATRDMETLRFAVAEFAVVVRRLASERFLADNVGQNAVKRDVAGALAQPVPQVHSDGTIYARGT